MKNKLQWKPTKCYKTENGFKINPDFVNRSSLAIATLQLECYAPIINQYASGYLLDCACMMVPYYEIYKDNILDNFCIDAKMNSFIDLQVDLNRKIPLESNTFDTILFTDVLQYISNPDQIFAEFDRLLKEHGKLILTVPFLYNLHDEPYDLYRYTEFALKNKCEENHLYIIDLKIYGGMPDIFFDLVNKTKLANRFFIPFFNWIRKLKWYQQIRDSRKNRFPLGYCLVAEKRNNSN